MKLKVVSFLGEQVLIPSDSRRIFSFFPKTKKLQTLDNLLPFKVHVPLGFAEHSPNGTAFSDNLKELDMNFGRMIQTVKDLGLYENTVIWLISDNGPWELQCQYAGTFASLFCQGNSINT